MKQEKPYTIFKKIFAYIQYWFRSKNRHGVHSPFVYDFVEKLLNASYEDTAIEAERAKLLKDNSIIKLRDLGAGKDRISTIAQVASKSLKKPKEAQLLAKIVQHFNIDHVIELGTSFGISTAYMARAKKEISIQSIEGSKNVLDIAKKVWNKLKITSITPIHSSFDDFLAQITFQKNSLIFIDGNHSYEATARYFNFLITRAREGSIIIFDDIHWSKGMERAWAEIIADSRIHLSIDLFELGIVFLDPRMEKEHFIIRY